MTHDELIAASITINQRTWQPHFATLAEYVADRYSITLPTLIGQRVAWLCRKAILGDALRSGALLSTNFHRSNGYGMQLYRLAHDSRLPALWLQDGLPRRLWHRYKLQYLPRARQQPGRRAQHRHQPWAYCKVTCKHHGTPFTTR